MRDEIINKIGNCSNVNCICNPKNEAFIEITDDIVFLCDKNTKTKTPCEIVKESEDFHLTIKNNSKTNIWLVKNDSCINNDDTIKKCDAFLYTDKEFYFIEFKDVKLKQKKTARKQAIEQLESSIKQLKKLNFGKREKYAIIGFSKPKTSAIQSSNNTQKVKFFEDYNTILKEGHILTIN